MPVSRFDDDLIGQYGVLDDGLKCGVKRSVEETTPPSSTHKMRLMENGATPTTPLSSRRPQAVNHSTTPGHNGYVSDHDTTEPCTELWPTDSPRQHQLDHTSRERTLEP